MAAARALRFSRLQRFGHLKRLYLTTHTCALVRVYGTFLTALRPRAYAHFAQTRAQIRFTLRRVPQCCAPYLSLRRETSDLLPHIASLFTCATTAHLSCVSVASPSPSPRLPAPPLGGLLPPAPFASHTCLASYAGRRGGECHLDCTHCPLPHTAPATAHHLGGPVSCLPAAPHRTWHTCLRAGARAPLPVPAWQPDGTTGMTDSFVCGTPIPVTCNLTPKGKSHIETWWTDKHWLALANRHCPPRRLLRYTHTCPGRDGIFAHNKQKRNCGRLVLGGS